jgi:hypothetical protein
LYLIPLDFPQNSTGFIVVFICYEVYFFFQQILYLYCVHRHTLDNVWSQKITHLVTLEPKNLKAAEVTFLQIFQSVIMNIFYI